MISVEVFAKTVVKAACLIGREGRTYCNDFAGLADLIFGSGTLLGTYANDQVVNIESSPHWLECDAAGAQSYANASVLALACWRSADTGNGGHICIVVPGKCQESGQFQSFMPIVANVGAANFYGKHAGYAFKKEQRPKFYAWLPNHTSSLQP